MGYQSKVDDDTLARIRNFVRMLNEEYANGSLIVVEGKRDADALTRVGFTGTPTVFHHFKGIADFLDFHQLGGKKMILLLDMDRTGKFLTRKILSQLRASRHDVNLSYKSALARITKGKVKHVEDLAMFAPHLSGVTGSRRDLYFYTYRISRLTKHLYSSREKSVMYYQNYEVMKKIAKHWYRKVSC